MSRKRAVANWLRFVLGLVIALLLAIDSYLAERGAMWTYVLPFAIVIYTLADFIGYLATRATGSSADPDAAAGGGA